MNYGVKYQYEFLNRQQDRFRVEILQKNYTGDITELEGAGNPFVLSYQSGDGDIYTPVRGSEAVLEFWNENTPNSLIPDYTIGIADFYSDDDTFTRVDFYSAEIDGEAPTDKLLWTGFLILDNCSEDAQGKAHIISLNANDNLGLIDNVDFKTAFIDYESETYTYSVQFRNQLIGGAQIIIAAASGSIPEIQAGAQLIFFGTSNDGAYTIISYTYNTGTSHYICNVGPYLFNLETITTTFKVYDESDYKDQFLLKDVIKYCLSATGLNIACDAYLNVFENSTSDRTSVSTKDLLQQTVVIAADLQNDRTTWKSCFNILTELLIPIKATLYQSNGRWVIYRQGEFRLFTNAAVPGTAYNPDFSINSAITLNPKVNIERDIIEPINANQIKRVLRPYRYVQKTFNYTQPIWLIKNFDISVLGALREQYTSGTDTIREYEMPYWFVRSGDPDPSDYFIRVIYNTSNIETERYAVLKGGAAGGPHVYSSTFYLQKNDRVSISFKLRTSDSQTGAADIVFVFRSVNGATIYKVNFNNNANPIDGSWTTNGGALLSYGATVDINQWQYFSVESLGVPQDGFFSIGLNQADFSGTINETQYADFSITHHPYVNEATQMLGHVHTNTQLSVTKNVSTDEIHFDDSPKKVIPGTFLTNATTGGQYLTQTSSWHRAAISESKKLGEITTFDELFIQRKTRTIIEGDFYGLRNGTEYLTLKNIFNWDQFSGLNFTYGIAQFDYMQAQWNATLYELFDDGETDSDLSSNYVFNYVYES